MTLIFFLVLVLIFNSTCEASINYYELLKTNSKLSEDGRLTFMGIAAKYGHPAEEHHIITEDGYNLTLFHIPGDKSRPMLLAHGNLIDADCFIIRGKSSLAITLADKGYDVWLINFRGSIYSDQHISSDIQNSMERFYNFSFYEKGVYDLPAAIDYVLLETGQTELLAAGHSLGNTVFYVLGAERPEYNDKIKAVIALAPICYTKNMRGPINILTIFGATFNEIAPALGPDKVLARDQLSTYLTQSFCLLPINYDICVKGLLFNFFGPDKAGFEPEFSSTYWGHFPGGGNKKTFEHLIQIGVRNKFAKYDYEAAGNMKIYNSSEPPEFDLSKVTMKVALFMGKNDYLADIKDVVRLRDQLPNVVHYQVLPYEKFNHIDFINGRYMSENFYPYLFDFLQNTLDNL